MVPKVMIGSPVGLFTQMPGSSMGCGLLGQPFAGGVDKSLDGVAHEHRA
jgi:hypothetical protein